MSSFQQSELYQIFLKITDITITDKTIDGLERNLLLIIDILSESIPTTNNESNKPSIHSSKHKRSIHEFIQKGYHIQLLQHLFSSYSVITKQWNNDKKSKLIFGLILSAQIPPHITIDSLITLWKGFVAQNIDTEQPSYSVKHDNYTMIANDIIALTKQLLSKQSHFMILLADWGTNISDNNHKSININKLSIHPQTQQNIRCIVSINDLFAPYFYLYRDYFRSLKNNHNNDQTQKHHLYENYKFFQRKYFMKYLIETSLKIITDYSSDKIQCENKEFNKIYQTTIKNNKHLQNLCKGVALFWSVLIRVGYVDMMNKSMIDHIKQSIECNGNFIIIVIGAVLIEYIAKLPGFEKWFESFLITISNDSYHNISYIENIKFMIHLLHRILNNNSYNSQIEYLLSHKLIISKALSLHTMDYIIALLNYLTVDNDFILDTKTDDDEDDDDDDSDDGHSSIMIETITDIGNIWSTKSFVRKANYDKQQYLTRALVLLIQYIIQRLIILNKPNDAATLIPFLFNGVQSRFSSDILKIRHLGMIVAEQYSKVFPDTDTLNFGADLSQIFNVKNGNKWKCGDIDDVINIIKHSKIDYDFKLILLKTEENGGNEMKNDNDDGIIGVDNNNNNNDDIKYIDNESTVDVSWLDEMRKKDMESGGSDDENVWSSDSDDNDDNDDNDDLEEYSLSDDEEDLRKVPLPSYIRECWDLLLAKQKPDETESGLIAATTLIRNNPSDLKNVCIGFCRTLLHLQNEYSLPNFAIHKRSALVALIVVCPDEILKYLPYQLYTKEWSVGVKLEILTVLVDAMREMGNLSALNEFNILNKNNEDKKSKAIDNDNNNNNDLSIISGYRSNSEKERWKIIDARIAMKTKRWASAPKHIPLKENKFANYATKFVYPILNGYHENESFLFEFPVLHTRLLFTLGCCIECSGKYGIHTVNIAKDIFELILAIYSCHKLPEIRRTSVFVLSRILLHVTSSILKEEYWFVTELNGLIGNLIHMVSNDNDYATRDLSRLCLNQLKQLFD